MSEVPASKEFSYTPSADVARTLQCLQNKDSFATGPEWPDGIWGAT
jgi:hypothetical protein